MKWHERCDASPLVGEVRAILRAAEPRADDPSAQPPESFVPEHMESVFGDLHDLAMEPQPPKPEPAPVSEECEPPKGRPLMVGGDVQPPVKIEAPKTAVHRPGPSGAHPRSGHSTGGDHRARLRSQRRRVQRPPDGSRSASGRRRATMEVPPGCAPREADPRDPHPHGQFPAVMSDVSPGEVSEGLKGAFPGRPLPPLSNGQASHSGPPAAP